MLAAGRDGALLRFSLGNEYLKAGEPESRRRASAARGRRSIRGTRPRGRCWAARLSDSAQPARRAGRLPRRHRGRAAQGRQAGGQGDGGVRAAHRESAGRAQGMTMLAGRLQPDCTAAEACRRPALAAPARRPRRDWRAHRRARCLRLSAWPWTQCQRSRDAAPRASPVRATGPRSSRASCPPSSSRCASSRGSRSRCRSSRTASPCRPPHRVARVSDSSARMTAVSSIRLLVVCASPPNSSFSCSPARSSAPQPPGPGLPLQAPSV